MPELFIIFIPSSILIHQGSPECRGNTVERLAFAICHKPLLRTGVPNPVTASQPTAAGKPVVLHPAEEPLVTSGKSQYHRTNRSEFKLHTSESFITISVKPRVKET